MSMFRSLQSLGGVITLFHSPKNASSLAILKQLERHSVDGPDTDDLKGQKFKYTVDICEKPPTPEQFNFIKSTLSINPVCKKAFKSAFPSITEGINLVADLQKIDGDSITKSETLEELTKKGLFVPPLVVDWDNKLIAAKEEQLPKIFQHYNKNEKD